MKTTKKLISTFLALVMMLTIIPMGMMSASAAGSGNMDYATIGELINGEDIDDVCFIINGSQYYRMNDNTKSHEEYIEWILETRHWSRDTAIIPQEWSNSSNFMFKIKGSTINYTAKINDTHTALESDPTICKLCGKEMPSQTCDLCVGCGHEESHHYGGHCIMCWSAESGSCESEDNYTACALEKDHSGDHSATAGPTHEHNSSAYGTSARQHWTKCTDDEDNNGIPTDHTWSNGQCSVCNYACLHTDMTTSDAACDICGKANPDYQAPAGSLCPDFSVYDDYVYGHLYVTNIEDSNVNFVLYDPQVDDPTRLLFIKPSSSLIGEEDRHENMTEVNTWYHYNKATDKFEKCSAQGEGSHPAFHKNYGLTYNGTQWLYGRVIPVYEGDMVYTALIDAGNECYAYNDGEKLEYNAEFTSVIVKIDGNSIYLCSDHTGMTTSDATCSTCGMANPNYVPPHTHTYATAWTTDATSHWHAATCTHTTEKSDLANHSGGTATCTAAAVCSTCGASYGSLGGHSYATTWSSNDAKHWHAATCEHTTLKSDEANHSYGTTGATRYTCSVCQAVNQTKKAQADATDLANAKTEAKNAIDNALGDCTDNDVVSYATSVKSDIDNATSISDVNTYKNNGVSEIQLSIAKLEAKQAIDDALGECEDEDANDIATIAKNAIDNATSITDVDEIKTQGVSEVQTAVELAEAKAQLIDEIMNEIDGCTFQDVLDVAEYYIEAIQSAADMDELDAISANALSDVQAAKVAAQELADAKADAKDAVSAILAGSNDSKLADFADTYLKAIDDATSVEDVETIKAQAVADVKAARELSDAKLAALDELSKELGNSKDEKLQGIFADYQKLINEADSIEKVNSLKADGIKAIADAKAGMKSPETGATAFGFGALGLGVALLTALKKKED